MKTRLWTAVFVLLGVLVLNAQTNDLTALLQQGLFEEQANRNLDAAIADYQSLALQFDKNRQLAATAVFRLGECYRAQGQTNEAAVQYQRILRDFSDQQTLAALSRQDLTGMGFSESVTKPATGGETSGSYPATAEASFLATQISGIEKLKADPEEQARAVLAIFPDDTLKNMLLNLPKLQDQVARMRANPQLSYNELIGTAGYRIAIGSDREGLSTEWHSTNLLADVQSELNKQQQWIQERVSFILGVQQARLKALQAANSSSAPGVSQNEGTAIVTSDEDQEIQRIQQMIQNSPDLINASSDGSTPLVKAAYNGWLKVAAYLLDHGADVNVASPDVRWTKELSEAGAVTPLTAAVFAGNKAMTKFLIDRGADINFKGLNGNAPLHLAARKGFQSVTEVLLASHADVNIHNNLGMTPLFSAAEAGQMKTLQMLLAAGADVNFKSNKGWTALNYGIATTPEIIHVLLDAGANPNTIDWIGRTPLSYAAEKDSPQVVKLLLDSKADPNTGKVDAPLLCAINKQKVESAELLLQADADPNKKSMVDWSMTFGARFHPNGGQFTPMCLAIETKQFPMVQLLLKYKADPDDSQSDDQPTLFNALSDTNALVALLAAGADANAHYQNSWTMLDDAVSHKNLGLVQLLLKYKADPNDSLMNGNSVLFSAVAETNILEALLNAGANVDPVTKDEANWTPLAAAAKDNNTVAVEILLKHGANPNVRNSNGATPLHWAAYVYADTNVFDLLFRYKADPNVRSSNGRTPLDEIKETLKDHNSWPARFSNYAGKEAHGKELIALLHQHGALDNLPDWNSITIGRPSANFFYPIFRRGTNDWNQFTLLETIANFYFSSETYSVPQGNNTWAGYGLSSMLPFPDLKHVVVVRPSHDSTNETRTVVNLLNQTNGIDCSKDMPLMFGDVVEIAERDHALGDNASGLANDQAGTLSDYLKGNVRLVVQDQQKDIPFYRLGNQASLDHVLNDSESRKLLLASSDLAHVKVVRHDPKSGEQHEWILDCSNSPGGNTPPGSPLSYQWIINPGAGQISNGNSSLPANGFWLRNGDVIEVPEKL